MKKFRRIMAAMLTIAMLVPLVAVAEDTDYIPQEEVISQLVEEYVPEVEAMELPFEDEETSYNLDSETDETILPPEEYDGQFDEESATQDVMFALSEDGTLPKAGESPESHTYNLIVDPAAKAQTKTISVGDTVRVYIINATVTTWKPSKKNKLATLQDKMKMVLIPNSMRTKSVRR